MFTTVLSVADDARLESERVLLHTRNCPLCLFMITMRKYSAKQLYNLTNRASGPLSGHSIRVSFKRSDSHQPQKRLLIILLSNANMHDRTGIYHSGAWLVIQHQLETKAFELCCSYN